MEDIEQKAREYDKRARAYAEAMHLKIDIDEAPLPQHECNKAYYHYNIGHQIGFEAGKQERDREIIEGLKIQMKNHPDPYYSEFLGDMIQRLENLSK